MDETIRIAICNLQTGIGTTRGYWHYLTTGWKYVLPHSSAPVEKAAEFLRSEAVDVAAICEIEAGSRRTRRVDQVQLLAGTTPLTEHAFFPTLVVGTPSNDRPRLNQGNAVCSRFPVRPIANHRLPGAGEPRLLSEAELTIGDAAVRLFVTHLSLERKVRTPQIHHLAEFLRERREPTILAGDFNIAMDAELDLLSEGDLQHAASAPTFPSWKPKKRLDHLFLSDHFSICEYDVFARFRFSDHLPLVATLEMSKSDE